MDAPSLAQSIPARPAGSWIVLSFLLILHEKSFDRQTQRERLAETKREINRDKARDKQRLREINIDKERKR